MASIDTVSADHAMVKAEFIGFHWFCMWVADDITPIQAIYQRAINELTGQGRADEWTVAQVAAALSKAYQAETLHRAVAEFLSPYGIDMPQFRSTARG